MKNLLTLFAVLAVALGMSAADWYLVGDSYGWTDNAANKFTANSDGTQSLTVASLSGNIKIKEAGKWNTSFGSNGQKLKEGVEYAAGTDGGNIAVDGVIANATITINPSTHKIMVKGKAAENEYTSVYLVGDFGKGWSEDIAKGIELKAVSGKANTYEAKVELTAATNYFKFKAGVNVYGTGGADVDVEVGESYTTTQSGNAFVLGAGSYTITLVLAKNADQGTFTVAGQGTTPTPDPEPTTQDVYLVGKFNEWTPADADYKFAEKDGVYTLSLDALDGEFKLVGDADWAWTFGGDAQMQEDVTVVDAVVGENIIWKGSSVNLKADNLSDVTLTFTYNGNQGLLVIEAEGTVTPTPDPEPTTQDVYLVGKFNEWTPADADYKFAEKDGVYTLSLDALDGEFKLVGDADWAWTFGGDAQMQEDVTVVDAVVGENIIWKGSSVNLKADNLSDVTLTFTYNDNQGLLVIEAEGTVTPTPDPDPTTKTVAIVGAFNEWNLTANATTEINDNCAVIVVNNYVNAVEGQGEGFKVNYDGAWYSAATVANGEWTDLSAEYDDNIDLSAAEGKTVKFTFAVDTHALLVEWSDGEEVLPGDANNDGEVSVSDVVFVCNYVLDIKPDTFNFAAADLNNDNEITVTDVVLVVNLVLSKDAPAEAPAKVVIKADSEDTGSLYVEDVKIAAGGEVEVEILLDTPDYDVTAFQFNMTLPEGLDVYAEDGEYIFDLADRCPKRSGHQIQNNRVNGEFIVLCYSSKSVNFDDREGAVALFTLEAAADFNGGDIEIYGVEVVEKDGTKHKLGAVTVKVTETTGVELVSADNAEAVYYNLQGVRVANPAHGIYVKVQGGKAVKVVK